MTATSTEPELLTAAAIQVPGSELPGRISKVSSAGQSRQPRFLLLDLKLQSFDILLHSATYSRHSAGQFHGQLAIAFTE